MKNLFLAVAALVLAPAVSVSAQQLSIASMNKVFETKTVRGVDPVAGSDQFIRVSDDGKQIVQCAFKDGKQTAVLFDVDNTMGSQISSFDGYVMSADGQKMLVYTNSEPIYRRSFKADYYIYNVRTRKLEPLSTGGKQQEAVFSPDGNQVAFVRDNDIWLVKLLYDNAETKVTKDGKVNEIINGVPDWVNEEEFAFSSSFCFTADGSQLCWLRYDESAVPTYSLQLFKGLSPEKTEYADYPGEYTYKYPKAGQTNSTVTAWSYDIKSRRTQQLQVPVDADGYMPRIKATSDPDNVIIYTLNRHQDDLRLYSVNPSTTLAQLIIQEKADRYIAEDVVSSVLIGNSSILLLSDRDGYNHLYLYNLNGQQLRQIGSGSDIVTDVYGYDEATGDVFYQVATTPMDRQVAVAHKNGKTEMLTTKAGYNSAILSGDYRYFMNTWSNMNTPYVVTLCNSSGKTLATLEDNAALAQKMAKNGWNRRETFSFTTSEGVTLNGWMVKPEAFNAAKKYPVIMYQYSGPGSQQVVDSWRASSMGQGYDYYLAQEGYIVVCVDGRGTGGRGADFEKCVYRNLGYLEAKDQVETALWLGKQSYVDADRIGIWGWSYGGFCTLMSMSEGRGVFACGVAVAPPTSWKYYDSVYTERYMRTPQENPEGYATNPIARANDLHGALLLCHGVADDNVHPQNTFEYAEALVQADKDFAEVLYTNRNHSIYGGNTRTHLMRQITNWFDKHLKD